MREIKFRAWDKREKRWIEPEWVDIRCSGIVVRHYIHRGYNIGEDKNPEYLDISQYTGLKDKNGREIYEGDIFGWDDFENCDGERAIMEYYQDFACWAFTFFSKHGGEGWGPIRDKPYAKILKDSEVIGNIYEQPGLLGEMPENPDLLGGKDA